MKDKKTIREQIDRIVNFHESHNNGKMLVFEFRKEALDFVEQRDEEILEMLEERIEYFKKPETEMNKAVIFLLEELKSSIVGDRIRVERIGKNTYQIKCPYCKNFNPVGSNREFMNKNIKTHLKNQHPNKIEFFQWK